MNSIYPYKIKGHIVRSLSEELQAALFRLFFLFVLKGSTIGQKDLRTCLEHYRHSWGNTEKLSEHNGVSKSHKKRKKPKNRMDISQLQAGGWQAGNGTERAGQGQSIKGRNKLQNKAHPNPRSACHDGSAGELGGREGSIHRLVMYGRQNITTAVDPTACIVHHAPG